MFHLSRQLYFVLDISAAQVGASAAAMKVVEQHDVVLPLSGSVVEGREVHRTMVERERERDCMRLQ